MYCVRRSWSTVAATKAATDIRSVHAPSSLLAANAYTYIGTRDAQSPAAPILSRARVHLLLFTACYILIHPSD
jgi:hypothetical protein